MNMLTKIAWRNIWRNRRRSWVLILAIAISVFVFLGMISYMDGLVIEMVDSSIDLQGGHVLISEEGYHTNPTIRSDVADVGRVEQVLSRVPGVRYAPEVTTPGMANSAEQAAGVVIHGIEPARESGITTIAQSVVEGTYLPAGTDENVVLVGQGLADRLNVRLGEKVVLMANDLDNEVSAGAYRVVGIYRTSSPDFDKANVYLPLSKAQALVGYDSQVSTISVRLDDGVDLSATVAAIKRGLSDAGLEVLSWRDRFPLLVLSLEAFDYSIIILVVILFTAVAFTIINSFLMVIFERIREIGIMMANGVRPRQVRLMLYLEAVFIVLIGMVLGAVAAAAGIWYWHRVGLDLSAFAEGLGSFGVSPVVYPYIDWTHIGLGFVIILVMVLLSVLYPAYKASRFELVEAINYV